MRNILITGILLFLASSTFAQPTTISESEFESMFRTASDLSNKSSNRTITLEEYFKEGKKSRFERHLNEEISPDRSRYLYEAEFNGVPEKREVIKIDGVSYCREGKGKWRKVSCDRFTGLGGMKDRKAESSVETVKREGKSIRIFRRTITYSDTDDKDQSILRKMYFEMEFELDDNGKLVHRGSKRGYKDSNEWNSVSRTSYEYNPPDLKIEAPIK